MFYFISRTTSQMIFILCRLGLEKLTVFCLPRLGPYLVFSHPFKGGSDQNGDCGLGGDHDLSCDGKALGTAGSPSGPARPHPFGGQRWGMRQEGHQTQALRLSSCIFQCVPPPRPLTFVGAPEVEPSGGPCPSLLLCFSAPLLPQLCSSATLQGSGWPGWTTHSPPFPSALSGIFLALPPSSFSPWPG